MKLVQIEKSTRKGKRFMAIFDLNGKQKTVHFGAEGGNTFLEHNDPIKRENYIRRHKALGTENWDKPDSSGALSRWILWEHKTLSAAISAFKKRFNL